MILRVAGLSKAFGGLRALDAFGIRVRSNTVHSIIGPNGSGKTTFFNVLTGVRSSDAGTVLFDEIDITNAPPSKIARLGIARTFQDIRLFKLMSIFDNVRVGTHAWTSANLFSALWRTRKHRQEEHLVAETALELLETYGLAARKDEFAQNLAYGDQRRLEILRALAQKPKLLLLDEPTAGMSAQESEELTAFIQHLRDDQGLTIIMIEHDMDVVMSISDQITVLDYGKKIAEGQADAIQNNPAVIEAYLGRGAAPVASPSQLG